MMEAFQSGAEAPRLRLLLIEDTPTDAILLITVLRDGGYPADVDWVTDGIEGMDFLMRRGKHKDASKPDAVLLDLHLPKKNGLDVLRDIKSEPTLRTLPVIILTTSRLGDDVTNGFRLQASGFLTKPMDLPGYEALVRGLFEKELSGLKRRSKRPRRSRT